MAREREREPQPPYAPTGSATLFPRLVSPFATTRARPKLPPSNHLIRAKWHKGSSHRRRGRPTLRLDQGPKRPPNKWLMAPLSAAERQRMTLTTIEQSGLDRRPKSDQASLNWAHSDKIGSCVLPNAGRNLARLAHIGSTSVEFGPSFADLDPGQPPIGLLSTLPELSPCSSYAGGVPSP